MIKKAKKSVAVGLSVALAVTSVNIPVNSASAAAKKAKLNVTKKTITAGKSATLTLKTNNKKAATIKSINVKYVTVTTSKKAVATVKKVSKNSKVTGIKVTAKKAGKSTITVKVTKGTYKGTYKCTVTVKAKPKATTKPTTKPTEEPTTAPTEEPTAAPTTAPTTEPTVEPATTPAITQAPLVQDVDKVDAIVTNSVKGYSNTVLAGQDATIQVKVTDKQGNPVANDNVVLRFDHDVTNGNNDYYTNKGNVVATTNAKGIATFVVGPNVSMKSTDSKYLGSYTFKVTEATENIAAEGKLNVATISYESSDKYVSKNTTRSADVLNLNGTAAYADIVKGTNSNKTQNDVLGYASQIANIASKSTDAADTHYSQYVGTQQVSSAGEDHKVAFKTAVYLNIPNQTKKEEKVTAYTQKIEQKSGSYETYDSKTLQVNYDIKDMSNVEYATLTFNSLNLSKYTKLVIRRNNKDGSVLKEYGGNESAFKQSNFGLQISKAELNGTTGLYLEIISKGQVNADNNAGFDVKDVTYVYNQQGTVNGDKVLLKNTSIKWSVDTPVYSEEVKLTDAEAAAIGIEIGSGAGKYALATKTVPVFPHVGNAIIKCYDANGVVQRYYACATKNKVKATGSEYENVNVLDTTAVDSYVISEDEATRSVGTINDKGDGTVEVDSTQTGTTYLVGTIASDDENVTIDAKNEKVYTSVMWNPIAKKEATVQSSDFAAVEGQSVTLTAQLVDKNNNPVSVKGTKIKWSGIEKTGITNITTETETDAKGQAVAKVSATEAMALTGISAEDTKGEYNVLLVLGDKQVSIANLYWVQLGLKYTASADSTTSESTIKDKSDGTDGTATVTASNVTVGETWKYAAELDAKIAGYTDSSVKVKNITGVNFNVAKATNSVGTVTVNGTVATVISNANGVGTIVNTLDSNISTKGAVMTLSNDKTLAFVGEGASNVDEELRINYTYGVTTGYTASFVTPLSQNALAGTSKTVYVKVVDNKGNVKEGVPVVFKNGSDEATVNTNAKGIAAYTIDNVATGASTITAKAGDLKEMSTIINGKSSIEFKATEMKYDSAAKTVKLSFSSNVYKDSVLAKSFEVTYTDSDNKEKVYDVTVSSVNENEIVLALPASASIDWPKTAKISVKVSEAKDDSDITYAVAASKTGETIANGTVYTVTGAGVFTTEK